MQSGEPNWAEVDGEAEMDYGTRPGLMLLPDLGPKLGGLAEDPVQDDDVPETNDPAVRRFLNSLPSNGPYRIMITNLPQNITKASLESELSKTYKITAAIQFRSGQHYCFLKFNNRSHCLESTSLFGARIHGAAVKLKVNPNDQQAEIRRANTARNNGSSSGHSRATLSGSTGGRFKNLTRDGTSSRKTQKHRHPVGGSIRKTKRSSNGTSNRINQSSHTIQKPLPKPSNPWNSESKSDYKILPRGKQPTSTSTNSRFSRNSASNVSSAPSRRDTGREDTRESRAAPPKRDNFRDRRNDRRDNDSDGFRRNDRRDNDSDGFRGRNDRSGRDDRNDRGGDRSGRDNDRGGRDNDRGGRDREDDAFNFRNRENRGTKMREEDGRADDAMNWRRGGTANKTIKRNTNPPPHAVTTDSSPTTTSSARPRVDRRDPVREPESDFSRRAMNSTQRKTNPRKEKENEAEKSKNRFTNKFALLDEEDDD